MEGTTLSFPRVHRDHAGLFQCEANNGIPEPAFQLYDITVLCTYKKTFKLFCSDNDKFQFLP